MKAVKSFTIVRRKWARGGYKGTSKLLNDDGNRCCLGFYLKACGVPDDEMRNVALPGHIEGTPAWLKVDRKNDREEHHIAWINDAIYLRGRAEDWSLITKKEREAMVVMVFALHGIKVKFE